MIGRQLAVLSLRTVLTESRQKYQKVGGDLIWCNLIRRFGKPNEKVNIVWVGKTKRLNNLHITTYYK